MFNSCSSWENCNFAQDEHSFYEDGSNAYCNVYADEKLGYMNSARNSVSPEAFYRNTSPTNEQCVNFNNGLYAAPPPRNFAYVGGLVPNGNISANTRHHPYQREYQSEYLTPYAENSLYQPQQQAQPPLYVEPPRPHLTVGATAPYNFCPPSHGNIVRSPEEVGDMLKAAAPCRGNQPWSYAYCYGYAYANQEPCHFMQCVDIEDFMNNEKRKEKSRDAARCRRSKETEIFTELAQNLPLKKDDVNQLDKASIMRIAIAYLKIRGMLELFPKIKSEHENSIDSDHKEFVMENEEGVEETETLAPMSDAKAHANELLKQTLDGFLIILSNDGDITYVSNNITEYLGISKIDILGQQIWEYSHQCDHAELREALNIKQNGLPDKVKDENLMEEGLSTDHRDLFVRFKCTLTSRGRSINIKSASYKVIHITGHLVVNTAGERVLVAIGRPIPHPSNIEIPLGTTTFLTKHSLDMKFTYVDEKMLNMFGYQSEDLMDKSLFSYHYGADSFNLMAAFKTVLNKGQVETDRYRFLGKYGGYCTIVTQATIVYDKLKPQSVVCVNYVISKLENDHEIYSLAQYEASQQRKSEDTSSSVASIEESTSDEKPAAHQIEPEEPIIAAISKVELLTESAESQPVKCEQTPTLAVIKNCTSLTPRPPPPPTDNLRVIEQTPTPLRRIPNIEEKRPKSVTASVFRAANTINNQVNLNSTTNPTTNNDITSLLNNVQLPPLNAAPRAQSVTASVFTPKSQLPPKQQQHIFSAKPPTTTTTTAAILGLQQQQSSPKSQPHQPGPQLQQDMNKGYILFTEDAELTMLKEEPDDLAHLAPTAADACMPLDENTPLFGEVLQGLMNSYGNLLPDDINSLDSTTSSSGDTTGNSNLSQVCNTSNNYSNSNAAVGNNKGGQIDPFINYREESNDTNCSQHLLSPSMASKSPEACSLPSLCSPNSLSHEDDFAFMTMNVDDDIDLTMRAPYIPMNEQDDLPLLTADDLMWCGGNGFTAEELNMHKDNDAMQQLQLQQPQDENFYQQTVAHQNQQVYHCSNSLSSSPASTVSSLSPSPVSQHQQTSGANNVFVGDSSELAALLAGSSSGTLSIISRCNGVEDSGEATIGSVGGGGLQQQVQQLQQQCVVDNTEFRLQHLQQQLQAHEQQQRQEQMAGLSVNCKTEKFDNALTSTLCNSIDDAFENVYSKNSTNLDCWNELLQLNVNDTSSSEATPASTTLTTTTLTTQQLEDMQQQQNIIVNAVPLITIQSNKNGQRLSNQLQNPLMIKEEVLGNNRPGNANKLTTIKLMKGTATTPLVRLIEQKSQLQAQKTSHMLAQQGHGSKRHHVAANGGSQVETKRLKGSAKQSAIEGQANPQLLQQLMGSPAAKGAVAKELQCPPQKPQAPRKNQRWATGTPTKTVLSAANNPQQQQQQSNSVLKNLLISGCDDIVTDEQLKADSPLSPPFCVTPPPSLTEPLHCVTSTASVLRNFRNNPMFGGPGILPSPPFNTKHKLDSPSMESSDNTDASNDSGICTGSPRKIQPKPLMNGTISSYIHDEVALNGSAAVKELLSVKPSGAVDALDQPPPLLMSPGTTENGTGQNMGQMNSCASLVAKSPPPLELMDDDPGNPMLEPLLMELCNDDYNMNINTEQLLTDNDIYNVLNEWSHGLGV